MPEVHLPKMIHKSQLRKLPNNSQRQSMHKFSELRESIKTNGFDESLLARQLDDGTYEIIAGNHRYEAGLAEGMDEFPVVIREDWDDIKAQIESVRRNFIRGAIDSNAFTAQVNYLSEEKGLERDTIMDQMGFQSDEEFESLYREELELDQRVVESASATASAPAIRILDDLGSVVGHLLAEHGQTVPCSFLIFPVGGKQHMYVSVTPGVKAIVQNIAEECFKQHLDINVALSGLLNIGAHQSGFFTGKVDTDAIEEADQGEEGDDEFDPID
jgi:hypothetical protein